MAKRTEIQLGNSRKTLYSDELWYLVSLPDSGEITLEIRFQTDDPERTGWPDWVRTEFCVNKSNEDALGEVPYSDASHLLEAAKLSFIPEDIWNKAQEECKKLTPGSKG